MSISLPNCEDFFASAASSRDDIEESDADEDEFFGESLGEPLYEDCTEASVAVRLVAILWGIAVEAIVCVDEGFEVWKNSQDVTRGLCSDVLPSNSRELRGWTAKDDCR